VLELQLLVDKYSFREINGYNFILENASSIGIKKHMLSTTMWSNITEPVDKLVYHNIAKEKVLAAYKDGKLRGLAEFQPEEVIDIDYLGVSYHKPLEALDALIDKLVDIAKTYGSKAISINIDSTKTKMINELLSMGFRIISSEYRLKKVI
jgi:predicted aldo/keto reductase-like oxidoreductase